MHNFFGQITQQPRTRAAARLLVFAAVLSLPHVAAAADPKVKACLDAAEGGQQLRDQGKYLEASAQFAVCAAANCPNVIRADCTEWSADVKKRTPSVILVVHDSRGADVTAADVVVDDVPAQDALAGRAILMNPGSHEFRVTAEGSAPRSMIVVIREGDDRRRIAIELASNAPTTSSTSQVPVDPPPPPHKSGSAMPWVLLGVGVAGIGAGTYFGFKALSTKSDLEKSCAPTCTNRDVAPLKLQTLAADINLAGGIVIASVAIVMLVTGALDTDTARSTSARSRKASPFAFEF